MSSPRPKPNTKLLDAMIEEATVDAYHDEEQITGLFTMLEEHLALPFDTEMLGITVTVTKIDLHDGTGRTYTVTEDTPAQHHVRPEPPLRRWAARQALQSGPARLTELLSAAEQFEPRHRDAAIHGLLDAADVLDEPARRTVVDRGLRAAHGSVRIAALELLCELDGAEPARRLAAADPNAQVRKWRPPADKRAPSLFAT